MSVSNPTSNRASVPACLFPLLLIGMLAISSFAQDAAPQQNTAPAQQSAPDSSAAPQPATAQATAGSQQSVESTLTELPQAPAPQRNAHPYSEHDYTRGRWQWPNPFIIYAPREIGPLRVQNSTRVDQIIRDGKMYLSMDDAVAMALENNLDIGIQRYNLGIADTDILRTSSGAVALGVNAGLLQGTPGGQTGTTAAGGTGTSTTGATGGGVGGTTIGVGGAGAGAAGLVTSTQGEGPPLDSYDPVITGTVLWPTRLPRNPIRSSPEPTSCTPTPRRQTSATPKDFLQAR